MQEDVFEYKRSSWLNQITQILHYNRNKRVINNKDCDKEFVGDICRISDIQSQFSKSIWNQSKILHTQEQLEEIDLKARLHAEANKFNITSTLEFDQIEEDDRCYCGCKKGRGQDRPFCGNEENLTFLGPGIVLFFLFQKKIIYLVFITILIFSIFSVVTNGQQNLFDTRKSCQKEQAGILKEYCVLRGDYSIENKDPKSLQYSIQLWLGLVVSIIWIFGLRIIRVLSHQKNNILDEMLDSSSDYCIVLENLPFGNFNQKEIQHFLTSNWATSQARIKTGAQLDIKSIQIIYNMQQTRQLTSELQKEIHKIRTYLMCQSTQHADYQNQAQQTSNMGIVPQNSETLFYSKGANQNQSKIQKFLVRRSQRTRRLSSSQHQGPKHFGAKKFKSSNPKSLPPLNPKSDMVIRRQNIADYINSKSKIINLYEKLRDYRWNFLKNSDFRKRISTSSCLIEFVDQEQQRQFLEQFGSQRIPPLRVIKNAIMNWIAPEERSGLMFKDNLVKIRRAPQPSDIQWLNCQKQDSLTKNLIVWAITFFIVFISFWMLLFIRFVRTSWQPLKFLTFMVAVSLQCFNRLIWKTLVSLIKIEEKITKTQSIISAMSKAFFAQALNVIFLPLVVNTFMNENYSGAYGLIGMSMDYQIAAFVMMIFWNFIDVPYMVHRALLFFPFTRNRIIGALSDSVSGNINQYEQIRKVLTYYELPQFPIAGGYVFYTTLLNHAFFFCHIQPFLIIIVFLNFLTFFLINKYLLYKRCKLPELTDIMVVETCITLSKNIPLMYAGGSIFFILYTNGSFGDCIPSILCIVITFIAFLNPYKWFTKITTILVKNFFQAQEMSPKQISEKPLSKKSVKAQREAEKHMQSTASPVVIVENTEQFWINHKYPNEQVIEKIFDKMGVLPGTFNQQQNVFYKDGIVEQDPFQKDGIVQYNPLMDKMIIKQNPFNDKENFEQKSGFNKEMTKQSSLDSFSDIVQHNLLQMYDAIMESTKQNDVSPLQIIETQKVTEDNNKVQERLTRKTKPSKTKLLRARSAEYTYENDRRFLEVLKTNPLQVLEESQMEDKQSAQNSQQNQGKGVIFENGSNFSGVSNVDKETTSANFSVIMNNSIIKKMLKKLGDQQQSTRKQCYFSKSNLDQLFNFQKQFTLPDNRVGNRSKRFCESFAFQGSSKGVTTFNLIPFSRQTSNITAKNK